MFRFIYNNWKRNKSRFIPMMIGVLIISSGLGYIAGVQETNKGTIEEILQKRWKASYDIVVKPSESASITETDGLLEPNYQNGISGGISFEQYETIKAMEDIEVAAPIAVIGNSETFINFARVKDDVKEPGVYKVTEKLIADNGVNKDVHKNSYYFTNGLWAPDPKRLEEYGAMHDWFGAFGTSTNQLLVAIDPAEEQKLVNLQGAIVTQGNSRYFSDGDKTYTAKGGLTKSNGEEVPVEYTGIPVLVNSESFSDEKFHYTIEKLDLPFSNFDIANETMKKVLDRGGKAYLDGVEAKIFKEYHYDSKFARRIMVGNLTGIDPETKQTFDLPDARVFFTFSIDTKASPLEFSETTSPFPEKWQNAFTIKPYQFQINEKKIDGYRNRLPYAEETKDVPLASPYYVGLFDPKKLNLSKDPLTELPMETYRPASGRLVLNENGKPVNPPLDIKSENSPYSFLTRPPSLLTTLDAVKEVVKRTPAMGDKPISVIRIKVSGVDSLSEESQAKLEKVAKELKKRQALAPKLRLGPRLSQFSPIFQRLVIRKL
jgi:hypothetical protein